MKFKRLLFVFILVSGTPALSDHCQELLTKFLPVPNLRQFCNYSCGATSLLSVLYYYRVFDGREDQLIKLLNTEPHQGTSPEKIVEVAKKFGLQATLKHDSTIEEIEAHLRKGHPVMVALQSGPLPAGMSSFLDVWNEGHWLLVIGSVDGRLYFNDPGVPPPDYSSATKAEFYERWHDHRMENDMRVIYRQLAIFIEGDLPQRITPAIREL